MNYGRNAGNKGKTTNVFAGTGVAGMPTIPKKAITPSIGNTSNVNTPQIIWSDFLRVLIKVLETVLEVTSLSANVKRLEDAEMAESSLDAPDEDLIRTVHARINEARRTKQAYEDQYNQQLDDLCQKLSVAMKLSQPKASAVHSTSATPTSYLPTPSPASPMPPWTISQPASASNDEIRELREALEKSTQALEAANNDKARLEKSIEDLASSYKKMEDRVANYAGTMGKIDARLPGGWETESKLATTTALEELSARVDAMNASSDSRTQSVTQPGSTNPYVMGGGVAGRLSLEALESRLTKLSNAFDEQRKYTRELRDSFNLKLASHKQSSGGETGADETSNQMIVGDETSFDVGLEKRISVLEGRAHVADSDTSLRQDLNAEMGKRQDLNKEVQELKKWRDQNAIQQLDGHAETLQTTAKWQEDAEGNMKYFYQLLIDIYDNQLTNATMPERQDD